LLAGYACLAANTALLVLALRRGELSVLYPIIALTYVWVTILSPMFFGDVINPYKVAGVALIVLGVSLIGLGSRS
jgi:drug/metabolite transporter (DMT)-like permease